MSKDKKYIQVRYSNEDGEVTGYMKGWQMYTIAALTGYGIGTLIGQGAKLVIKALDKKF